MDCFRRDKKVMPNTLELAQALQSLKLSNPVQSCLLQYQSQSVQEPQVVSPLKQAKPQQYESVVRDDLQDENLIEVVLKQQFRPPPVRSTQNYVDLSHPDFKRKQSNKKSSVPKTASKTQVNKKPPWNSRYSTNHAMKTRIKTEYSPPKEKVTRKLFAEKVKKNLEKDKENTHSNKNQSQPQKFKFSQHYGLLCWASDKGTSHH